MTINSTLKILMCTSALAFAGMTTASAHQHEAGEAAASQMTDKAKDKAVDMATDKVQEMVQEKAMDQSAAEAASPEGVMVKGASQSMKESATDMAMDKAKGMAKKEVLGDAGSGIAGQVEHSMKEKAMDHAMDKAGDHAKGMMVKEGAAADAVVEAPEVVAAPMPAPAQTVIMNTPAVENAAPQSQPAKLLSFDEALSACRGAADLQACIDERTGQGALRQQIHNSRAGS